MNFTNKHKRESLKKYSKDELIEFILKKDESINKLKFRKNNLIKKFEQLNYARQEITKIMNNGKC